ncbi:hypothetical protein PoB_004676800 [Plakobranchus ocellatus]|uniref:Uncharacterized protein n=1 Tax=Plakobranchus ocellatus TaxID=259542 RepID=A0AAV4BN88_9GAST|nr:hypothetical protein PoB_004676800 [Plakobranchus ocellatus]
MEVERNAFLSVGEQRFDQLLGLALVIENMTESVNYEGSDLLQKISEKDWGVGGTVASESALRSAGTLLSRFRVPPPAPWPDVTEGPKP